MPGDDVRRVLVVDDHHMFVSLLSTALSVEPDLECVGTAHDTTSALARARELRPDVVVMDVRLGDGDGIAAARELLAELPETRVVVLTAFADPRLVERAADAGVSALLAKDGEIDHLLHTLRTARRDSFTSGVGVPAAGEQLEARFAAVGLTPADGTLLRLLAAGMGADELARELGIEAGAARRQVQQVLAALGARTHAEAVTAAVRRGLLQVGHG